MGRNVRKALAILLTIIIIWGVSGCMNPENNVKINEQILSYLTEKYHTEFTIKEIYQEFDGKNGMSYRAICCSAEYSDEFAVYCSQERSAAPDAIEAEGKVFAIEDEYAEVLLQNKILGELANNISDDVFVGCRITFRYDQPTVSENWQDSLMEADAYVRIYIITDGAPADDLRQQAEALLEQYRPYTGYVYYVVKASFDMQQIQEVYAENQHDFGNYLTDSDFADRIEFTLYSENALQERKVIKE